MLFSILTAAFFAFASTSLANDFPTDDFCRPCTLTDPPCDHEPCLSRNVCRFVSGTSLMACQMARAAGIQSGVPLEKAVCNPNTRHNSTLLRLTINQGNMLMGYGLACRIPQFRSRLRRRVRRPRCATAATSPEISSVKTML
jgi:hypothetical protein